MDIDPINTCIITTVEYARLVRYAAYLDCILAHEIDKVYPSEAEKEILRIKKIICPCALDCELRGVPMVEPDSGAGPEAPKEESDDA